MTSLPSHCVHLGTYNDSATILGYPSVGNCCYRFHPAAPVVLAHQEQYCLGAGHVNCPVFQASEGTQLPPIQKAGYHSGRFKWGKAAWGLASAVVVVALFLGGWLIYSNLFAARGLLAVAKPSEVIEFAPTSLLDVTTAKPTTATTTPRATATILAVTEAAIPPATATQTTTATGTMAPTVTPSPTAVPSTPTPRPQLVVAVERLNTRSGPGTNYPVIQVVTEGERFDVIGRTGDGSWWQICCLAGVEAWIFGESVTAPTIDDTIPIISNIPPPVTP